MKLNVFPIGVISSLMTFGSALGGEALPALEPAGAPLELKPVCDCFDHGATSIDLFGVYVAPSEGAGRDIDGSFGGGIGLTRYTNSYLGFSTGVYWWDDGESTVHSVTGSVLFRYPVRSMCVAPYLITGFGGHFDSVNQLTAHAGVGLEIRVPSIKNMGVFVEGTYNWTDATENYAVFRLGTRYEF